MRVTNLGIVVSLMASLIMGNAARAQIKGPPDGKQPLSSSKQVVRFTAGPELNLTNSVLDLLRNQDLLAEAIKDVSADAAKDPTTKIASVEALPLEWPGPGSVHLKVHSYDERVPADKLAAAIHKVIVKWLTASDVEHQADEKYKLELLDRLFAYANELEKEEVARGTLQKIYKVAPSPELGQQRHMRIETELQASNVLLAGLKVRRELLEERIAEVGKQITEATTNDAVVKELAKAVEALEGRFESLKEQKSRLTEERNSSPPEISKAYRQGTDAERQLVESRAELAKARRDAVQAVGGQRLADLRRRLDETIIDISENEAREKVLEKQFQESNYSSSQCELQSMKVDLLKQNYRARAQELNELRAKLNRYQAPQVTVLQSTDSGESAAK